MRFDVPVRIRHGVSMAGLAAVPCAVSYVPGCIPGAINYDSAGNPILDSSGVPTITPSGPYHDAASVAPNAGYAPTPEFSAADYARLKAMPGPGIGPGPGQCPMDATGNCNGSNCVIYRECDPYTGMQHMQYALPGGNVPNANIWTYDQTTGKWIWLDATGNPGTPPSYEHPPTSTSPVTPLYSTLISGGGSGTQGGSGSVLSSQPVVNKGGSPTGPNPFLPQKATPQGSSSTSGQPGAGPDLVGNPFTCPPGSTAPACQQPSQPSGGIFGIDFSNPTTLLTLVGIGIGLMVLMGGKGGR